MVLGEMVIRSGPFGDEPTCRAYEGQDLGELLSGAIANINAEIQEVEIDELTESENKSDADFLTRILANESKHLDLFTLL